MRGARSAARAIIAWGMTDTHLLSSHPGRIPRQMATTIGLETANLAIEDRIMGPDGMRDFPSEIGPRLEQVAVPRDQLAVVAAHVRERPKAVKLRLKHKRRPVEGLRNAQKAHRSVGLQHAAWNRQHTHTDVTHELRPTK
jgi:hypothetical protein